MFYLGGVSTLKETNDRYPEDQREAKTYMTGNLKGRRSSSGSHLQLRGTLTSL